MSEGYRTVDFHGRPIIVTGVTPDPCLDNPSFPCRERWPRNPELWCPVCKTDDGPLDV